MANEPSAYTHKASEKMRCIPIDDQDVAVFHLKGGCNISRGVRVFTRV